jgi:hypothetical protein
MSHFARLMLYAFAIILLSATQSLGQVHRVSKEQLKGPIQECIVEVNAAQPTDLACSLPKNAHYYFEKFLKNSSDGGGGFNWKPCGSDDMCPGANGSWTGVIELKEEAERYAVQSRIVPFTTCNGQTCVVRARMTVTYSVQ